ncbi:hypothetical protein GUI12_03900 [Anaplasmataceae bacterium AB001_6]|nr:hypothetical protein GUI12_03900 [Anaplasmataceae bacterium AB001_6]
MKKNFISFFLISILFISFFLGIWQVQRFIYKKKLANNLNKQVQMFSEVSFLSQHDNLSPYMIIGQVVGFRKYFFAGYNKYKVLVPISIFGTDKIIYVDLGCTDIYKRDNIRFDTPIAGVGRIMFHKQKSFVNNNIKDNIWFWYDYDALSLDLNKKVEPYTFHFMDYQTECIDANTDISVNNIHGFYIFFWYAIFFLDLLFIYRIFVRKV